MSSAIPTFDEAKDALLFRLTENLIKDEEFLKQEMPFFLVYLKI